MSQPLIEALRSGRVLLMDGGMGTELQRRGLRPPQRSEDWNLDRPDDVRAVHQSYADAGAEVLLTNTFQANPVALHEREAAQPHFLSDAFHAAVRLAAAAITPGHFLLVDVGPVVDENNAQFVNLDAFSRVVELAGIAGNGQVAGILLETCSTARVHYAVARAQQLGMPVLLSLTFRRRGADGYESFDGHLPEWFAERAAGWGVAALGVNCGPEIGVTDCAAIVRQYRSATNLPLFARPNAGSPMRNGDEWVYPHSPASMATQLPELLEAGVSMVGGCCGTTPAHIAAFRSVIDAWNARHEGKGASAP